VTTFPALENASFSHGGQDDEAEGSPQRRHACNCTPLYGAMQYKRRSFCPSPSPPTLLRCIVRQGKVVQRRSWPWATMNLSLATCESRRGQAWSRRERDAASPPSPSPPSSAMGTPRPASERRACVRVLIYRLETWLQRDPTQIQDFFCCSKGLADGRPGLLDCMAVMHARFPFGCIVARRVMDADAVISSPSFSYQFLSLFHHDS
jgi:hypothetical protein